jgi:hypothetical protein
MSLLHDFKSQEISPASTACKNWSESRESSISVDSIDAGNLNSNREEKNLNYETEQDEMKSAGYWETEVLSSSERRSGNLNAQREKHEGGEIHSGSSTPVRGWSALPPEAMKTLEQMTSPSPQTLVPERHHVASFGDGIFQHLRQNDLDRSMTELQRCYSPSDFQQGLFAQLSKNVGFSSRGKRSDQNCVPTTNFPDLTSSIISTEVQQKFDSLRSENAQRLGAFSSSEVPDSQIAGSSVQQVQGENVPS